MDNISIYQALQPERARIFSEDLDDAQYFAELEAFPSPANTLQTAWSDFFRNALAAMVAERTDVFVAGNLRWYPVEKQPDIFQTPDAMLVAGRPKAERKYYKQWREANTAPQVVFEVIGNTTENIADALAKPEWYCRYGVQELYQYDPIRNVLNAWFRARNEDGTLAQHFTHVQNINGWRSPFLGITFLLNATTLTILRPDGKTFEGYMDAIRRADAEEKLREEAQMRARLLQEQNQRMASKLRELGFSPDDI